MKKKIDEDKRKVLELVALPGLPAFTFSHLPSPDRQMSIYGLVVEKEKVVPDEGLR